MSNRKFFSGLPEGMMTRASRGPNRQQTNFFWPDDTRPAELSHRMRNRSLSTASIISQSQASTDTEESRRRRTNQMKSRIEFYDMVDTGTDNESVYSRSIDPTKHKKLETLKSRIEFYDYANDTNNDDDDRNSVIEVVALPKEQEVKSNLKMAEAPPAGSSKPLDKVDELANGVNKMSINNSKNSQYIDSFSDSEDENYRYQNNRRHYREPVDRNQAYQRRPPVPQQQQLPLPSSHRPRRYNSHYFDEEDFDDGYDRYYDNRSVRSRFSRTMPRRNYSPDISDEDDDEFYDRRRRMGRNYQPFPAERDYARYHDSYAPPPPPREERRMNHARGMNGYGSEMERMQKLPPKQLPQRQQQQQSAIESEKPQQHQQEAQSTSTRPPIKPVARSMSINEARRRHHVNLKSNIFHTDNEYEQVVEQRRPLSVRDFAANHRIGVGLPDFQ